MTASASARTLIREPLLNIAAIAAICHDANRRLCRALGDESQPYWSEAEQWQRDSAVSGVLAILEGDVRQPWESHQHWMADKERDGWKYGPVKDPVKKEHPCMVNYASLPPEQRWKDEVFFAIVCALSAPMPSGETGIGTTMPASVPEGVASLAGKTTGDLLVDDINHVRSGVKLVAGDLALLKKDVGRGHFAGRLGEDRGEVMANLTLAFRHLEDASMRLGKAIQMRDGGVSVYDRMTTVGVNGEPQVTTGPDGLKRLFGVIELNLSDLEKRVPNGIGEVLDRAVEDVRGRLAIEIRKQLNLTL